MRAATLPDIVCRCGADGTAVVEGIYQTWVWHSPIGFEWGYGGSGPADLALNILLAATTDRDFRPRLDRGMRCQPTHEGNPFMTTFQTELERAFDFDRLEATLCIRFGIVCGVPAGVFIVSFRKRQGLMVLLERSGS